MFYVFHGNDTFSCAEELRALIAKMDDPVMASLNTTHLDGRTVTLKELIHHCDTIPFLSDRRLVIVKGLLTRLAGKAKSGTEASLLSELVDYMPTMPSTTRLILIEDRELSKRHPVLALAQQSDSGYTKAFISRTGPALTRWVQKRASQAGGEIDRHTAELLCAFVGNDLHQLDQEIQKLAAYTDGQRPITEQDMQLLTPHMREANIFNMVDALGRRDSKTASRIYHQLLDAGAHPLALLSMIARQFRLMIQIKELAPQLLTPEAIARKIKQNPYPVKKVLSQSRNYMMEQLHVIYHQLLDTDVGIKTGRIEPMLALDMLIAGLSRVA
jgi:DNA polymerase-3 subunit delta